VKKKELIRLEGSTLVIRNRPALEALAAYQRFQIVDFRF